MAWTTSIAVIEEATADAVEVVPTVKPLFFDATLYEPASKEEYLQELEQSATVQKTQDEIEAERKEKLLWSIAESRFASESARVQALRLLHEIQLFKTGVSEIIERIAQLEAQLHKSGAESHPRRGKRIA
jgi:hypothetical protein